MDDIERSLRQRLTQAAKRQQRGGVGCLFLAAGFFVGVPWLVWSYLALAVGLVPIVSTSLSAVVGTVLLSNGILMIVDARATMREVQNSQVLRVLFKDDQAEH